MCRSRDMRLCLADADSSYGVFTVGSVGEEYVCECGSVCVWVSGEAVC